MVFKRQQYDWRFEGSKLRLLTSQFGLNQIINEPTHITKNSSTCIDLLFTSETNLVIESGVHSSLYPLSPNCHHQIIFTKFDLRIFYTPCERNVWHYKQANIELIRQAVDFDWNRALDKVGPNIQVSIFKNTILNIIRNFIPKKLLFVVTEIHPGLIAKSRKSYMKKIKNKRKTLIINQTFYFYKTLIICMLK